MRSGIVGFAAVIVLIILIVLGLSSIFTVQQTEQALVLRFGQPVAGRGVRFSPGRQGKRPGVDTGVRRAKRIVDLETPNQEVLLADNQRLEVDAFAR